MIGGLVVALAALAAEPVHLGECEKPTRTVVERFEEMLVTGMPDAEVAFADCLAELGLPHSAQRHYLEVILQGMPGDAWMKAVDRSMALVDTLGDPHSVAPYIRGEEPRSVKLRHGRNAMYLVHGMNLISEGRLELAAVRLEEVDPDSIWGETAVLYQARALEKSGRLEPALGLYEQIEEGPWFEEALVQRATILAMWDRTDQALAVLDELAALPGDSSFEATSRVRYLIQLDRLDEAAAAAAEAQKLAQSGAFVPDGELVGAEVAAAQCRPRRVRKHTARHRARWEPVRRALDVAINVGNVNGEIVYGKWFGDDPLDWGLPQELVDHVRRPGPERQQVERHLAYLDEEIAALDNVENDEFQALVAPHLRRVIDDGKQRLQYLVGEGVAAELASVYIELTAHGMRADRLDERAAACP